MAKKRKKKEKGLRKGEWCPSCKEGVMGTVMLVAAGKKPKMYWECKNCAFRISTNDYRWQFRSNKTKKKKRGSKKRKPLFAKK